MNKGKIYFLSTMKRELFFTGKKKGAERATRPRSVPAPLSMRTLRLRGLKAYCRAFRSPCTGFLHCFLHNSITVILFRISDFTRPIDARDC